MIHKVWRVAAQLAMRNWQRKLTCNRANWQCKLNAKSCFMPAPDSAWHPTQDLGEGVRIKLQDRTGHRPRGQARMAEPRARGRSRSQQQKKPNGPERSRISVRRRQTTTMNTLQSRRCARACLWCSFFRPPKFVFKLFRW